MPVFRPTKAMIRARFILQRNCPPQVLKNLTPDDNDLPQYLAPFPVKTITKWASGHRGFWSWFLTPCDFEPKFLEAKELALKFYVSMLKAPHMTVNPDTGKEEVDKVLLHAKLKIAERLVGSKEDKGIQVNVNQNTQNLNAPGDRTPLLPAAIKRNPSLLEGKIHQLREARLQQEDVIHEIGEGEYVSN